jgi:hypothetical protein
MDIHFLKPNSSGTSILLLWKKWLILLCVTFPGTLEKVINSEIGLQFDMLVLSPFLHIGFITEI